MNKLENELTWSVTRAQLFQSCQRAYYYNHYGSWEGWLADADEKTRLLYLLKNITSLPKWAGAIVHDTIKDALTLTASTGQKPTKQALQDAALSRMRSTWMEYLNKEWIKSPKKTNIFELYYGDGENYGELKRLPKEQTDAVKEKIMTCLEFFSFSPIVKQFLELPTKNWKTIDQLDSFKVDDIKVWCALDFAFEDNEGIIHILDWKTGGENKANLRQQLACYALYATQAFNVPLEKIALHGVFLNDGGRCSDYPVQADLLTNVSQQIKASYQAMKAKLTDPDKNLATEDNFQCNPSEFNCRQCNFRRVCPAIN